MSIYIQQTLNETSLTYSNIPDIVAVYDPLHTYAIGDYARIGTNVYISAASSNLGKSPLDYIGIYWTLWSVSNAHAMFDLLEGTNTTWEADGIIEFIRGSKDTLGIGSYVANSIKLEYKDALGVVILTETYSASINQYVYDLWDYIYAPFTFGNVRAVYIPLKRIGVSIRVTFQGGGAATSCGYCVAGIAESMGDTLDQVSMTNRPIGSQNASVATFTTSVLKLALSDITYRGKNLIDVPMMFIIDPSLDSSFKNLVIIGKIKKCDSTAEVMSNNKIAWEIEQNVEV